MELKKRKIEIEVIDFDSMDIKELTMYGIMFLVDKTSAKEMVESGRGEEAAINAYNEMMYATKIESELKKHKESENK